MLTKKQYQLLKFIDTRLKETAVCPSFDEMKDAVGLKSKSGIHRLISALEERGFVKKLPHRARALEVVKVPKIKKFEAEAAANQASAAPAPANSNDVVELPLYGKIAAGTPIEAIADESNRIKIPTDFASSGELYALTIDGDSMIEAGINDGDTVIIQKCQTARNGDIVVALIDDQEATLKEYKSVGNEIHLIPHNAQHETRVMSRGNLKIQGKLVSLMRTYH